MGREQFVVERDDRLAAARIALAGAAAEELAVDAARVVVFGQDHVQAAARGDALAEHDVGAAAGHVGRDGDAARLAGARDDLGLVAVLLGVQHDVRDAAAASTRRQLLGCPTVRVPISTGRPCAPAMSAHRVGDGMPLRLGIAQAAHAARAPLRRPVQRHARDRQAVGAADLGRDFGGRAGHAGQPQVAAEQALVGDARQRVAPAGERDASLPSIIWCRPCSQARSGITRPVDSSTICTLPSTTT